MKQYRFTVYGEPKAKARPRVTRSGFAYTPKDTVMYENLVRTSFTEQCQPERLLEGEIEASMVAYFKIPQSVSSKKKKQMMDGKIRPVKKPDLDNIAKAILDSLNERAYRDDSCIISLTISKLYSEQPRVEVILKERKEESEQLMLV